MLITQKCQYAIRAIFELAKRYGDGPVKIGDIAENQAIPPRFLEVILSQLKQGGFVTSQRGSEGGYMLIRQPGKLSVGEIMRFIQGPIAPVECLFGAAKDKCSLSPDCVFLPMWEKARKAMSDVYDRTSYQDLLNAEQEKQPQGAPGYCI